MTNSCNGHKTFICWLYSTAVWLSAWSRALLPSFFSPSLKIMSYGWAHALKIWKCHEGKWTELIWKKTFPLPFYGILSNRVIKRFISAWTLMPKRSNHREKVGLAPQLYIYTHTNPQLYPGEFWAQSVWCPPQRKTNVILMTLSFGSWRTDTPSPIGWRAHSRDLCGVVQQDRWGKSRTCQCLCLLTDRSFYASRAL